MRSCLPIAVLAAATLSAAQDVDPGKLVFGSRCARCHGADGSGGEMGPDIRSRAVFRNDEQLAKIFHEGSSAMPPVAVTESELAPLIRFLRSIEPSHHPLQRVNARTLDGKILEGELLNQGFDDLQLRADDGRIHLLRRVGGRFREASGGVDWVGYNGDPGGNRYSTLTQITKDNLDRLAPRWTFTLQGTGLLQATPVVVGGIMYMPASNECYALDAGTGRELWHYQAPGEKTGGTNRGVAVAGDRVFMETEKAHIIALNRMTGERVWDTEMADWRQSYFATSAPLVAAGLVVAGVGGGEHGTRGFLAAYDQRTGKEVWRFWTVPLPGEPKSETWQGRGIEHGGAPTWFTGTYDRELDVVYWPTGNPAAEYYGDDRGGDNLYSDCILALDAKTGKLKWYYQGTPHDLWDWDATETPVVIDAVWEDRPRKLLLHANRNGFFMSSIAPMAGCSSRSDSSAS